MLLVYKEKSDMKGVSKGLLVSDSSDWRSAGLSHRGFKRTLLGSYSFTAVYIRLMVALIVCVWFIMSCGLNRCRWTQFLQCQA